MKNKDKTENEGFLACWVTKTTKNECVLTYSLQIRQSLRDDQAEKVYYESKCEL